MQPLHLLHHLLLQQIPQILPQAPPLQQAPPPPQVLPQAPLQVAEKLLSTPPGRMVGSLVVSMAMLRKTPLPLPRQKVPLLAPPREVTMTQS